MNKAKIVSIIDKFKFFILLFLVVMGSSFPPVPTTVIHMMSIGFESLALEMWLDLKSGINIVINSTSSIICLCLLHKRGNFPFYLYNCYE